MPGGRGEVVSQHSDRGGLEIVELTPSRGPSKRQNRHEDHRQGRWHQNVEDGHRGASKVFERTLSRITVSELTGIITAAINGSIVPVTANAAPTRL